LGQTEKLHETFVKFATILFWLKNPDNTQDCKAFFEVALRNSLATSTLLKTKFNWKPPALVRDVVDGSFNLLAFIVTFESAESQKPIKTSATSYYY